MIVALFVVRGASAQCTYLSNTDFENTQVSGSTYLIFSQSAGYISPWNTTASDGAQEIWRSGFNGVPAYSGSQFIELNANIAATTYQNFTAQGGTKFTLNFAHRGRDGVDVMNVSIGSPSPTSIASGTAVTGTTYMNLGNFSDGNTAWGYYSVTFTLPTGVTNNAFSVRFTSVSAAGGNTSIGNFLDAIAIADESPALTGSRSVTLTCPTVTTDLSSFSATNQPSGTTQTWHTGPVATTANKLSSTVVSTAGTYYTAFYNPSKACYGGTASVVVSGPTAVRTPTLTSTQPSCSVATGTITITDPIGTGLTYSIDGTTYGSSPVFSSVTAGTYLVRARNGTSSTSCLSQPTSVTINAQPPTPVTPAVSVTTPPNCTLATGTITISAPIGTSLTYSIDGVTYTNTSGVFSSVQPGVYAVTVRNGSGCISSAASITVIAQPSTPVTPTVSLLQPSCTLATGTITVTAPTGTGLTYSTNGSSYTNTSGVFSGVAAGVYTVTVRNASGCTSPASSVTVTAQPPTPAVTINSTSICAGSSTTLTASGCTGGTLNWSTSNTTTAIILSPFVTTVYSATCTNTAGCSAASSATLTVRATPSYTSMPVSTPSTCVGTVATNLGRINLSTLQNTERADIAVGSSYASGPVYGAGTNKLVANNAVSFTNLPNPATSQAYTIRLFSVAGTCYTDVGVVLDSINCQCRTPFCIPVNVSP